MNSSWLRSDPASTIHQARVTPQGSFRNSWRTCLWSDVNRSLKFLLYDSWVITGYFGSCMGYDRFDWVQHCYMIYMLLFSYCCMFWYSITLISNTPYIDSFQYAISSPTSTTMVSVGVWMGGMCVFFFLLIIFWLSLDLIVVSCCMICCLFTLNPIPLILSIPYMVPTM